MANVGAPIGNTNGSKKNRMVGDALRRAATQSPEKLSKACEALLDKAGEGDVQAFNAFRDTLDGKPHQVIEGTGEGGEIILKFTQDDESVL